MERISNGVLMPPSHDFVAPLLDLKGNSIFQNQKASQANRVAIIPSKILCQWSSSSSNHP
ncbi:MAG: hypothetical protein DMG06_00620 [Acidobacteria bacterium]|nr:MAG: hypothetical protein DMG06_00620 [Acidobacteriota bacterium]